MYRLPRRKGQLKNSRYPARATANEAALKKRDTRPGKSAVGKAEEPAGHNLLGGQWLVKDPETPLRLERRFVLSG
jgi:hypothetical protein